MGKRKTLEDYVRLGESRGFVWLGPEVPNTRTKTWWRCSWGHEWEARYGNIKDWGCPYCAGIAPKKPEDYHALAKEKGINWKGPFPKNTSHKSWWECQEGHRWNVPYSSIHSGRSCMICYRNNKMRTVDDYRALAKKRGFKWISQEIPPNVAIKTEWECKKGHRWMAHFGNINYGFGCPHCAGTITKIAKDYHKVALENGFKWLGPEVPNARTKTTWECGMGHQWEAIFATVQKGHGCPHCAGVAPKTPDDYMRLAKEKGFEWLGPFVPNVKIPTYWKCSKGHRWGAAYTQIQQGIGCLICAGNMPKIPKDYYSLAIKRGFKWLGPEAPNTQTKTFWACENDHCWETSYSSIQGGSGCPFCAGNMKKVPTDYHALAMERGFQWLGPKVSRTGIKTGWQCKEKHKWETTYNNIQQGQGCPICIDRVNGRPVSKPQREICKMVGGELNYPCNSYRIDIALPEEKIAIEYDCWYWHGPKQERDIQRDKDLLGAGWKILHIRTNLSLPTIQELKSALNRLRNGEKKTEIVLDGWGQGQTFADR